MEEPNGYELQRSIDSLRRDMREGLADIKVVVSGLVSRDLFDYKTALMDKDIEELRAELSKKADYNWKMWTQVVLPIFCLAGSVLVNVLR